MTTANDAAARAALAPTGRLRAGLNFSNFLLTRKERGTGYPAGIAVDLARELGKRLEVRLIFSVIRSLGQWLMRPARTSGTSRFWAPSRHVRM